MSKKNKSNLATASQASSTHINPFPYEPRTYRHLMARKGLVSFHVMHKETDLHIQAAKDLSPDVSSWIIEARLAIEEYITKHPIFLQSLTPLSSDLFAPQIVRQMLEASLACGVGPMAAVAGAVAEFVGKKCVEETCEEVIVENGGDIFAHLRNEAIFAIWAGKSELSQQIGIKLTPNKTGQTFGVCTSSGTVGHSLSFGKADAVTIVADSTALADAAATATANLVKDKGHVKTALEFMQTISGIYAGVVICDETIGAWGDVELVRL